MQKLNRKFLVSLVLASIAIMGMLVSGCSEGPRGLKGDPGQPGSAGLSFDQMSADFQNQFKNAIIDAVKTDPALAADVADLVKNDQATQLLIAGQVYAVLSDAQKKAIFQSGWSQLGPAIQADIQSSILAAVKTDPGILDLRYYLIHVSVSGAADPSNVKVVARLKNADNDTYGTIGTPTRGTGDFTIKLTIPGSYAVYAYLADSQLYDSVNGLGNIHVGPNDASVQSVSLTVPNEISASSYNAESTTPVIRSMTYDSLAAGKSATWQFVSTNPVADPKDLQLGDGFYVGAGKIVLSANALSANGKGFAVKAEYMKNAGATQAELDNLTPIADLDLAGNNIPGLFAPILTDGETPSKNDLFASALTIPVNQKDAVAEVKDGDGNIITPAEPAVAGDNVAAIKVTLVNTFDTNLYTRSGSIKLVQVTTPGADVLKLAGLENHN